MDDSTNKLDYNFVMCLSSSRHVQSIIMSLLLFLSSLTMVRANQTPNNSSVKSALGFFNTQLTLINVNRIHLNRNKGLVRYFGKDLTSIENLSLLDTPLGIMGFSIYILRFSTNLGLLGHLHFNESKSKDKKYKQDLYYSLLLDSLWSFVNLSQFFWLSYRNSNTLGLYGMQLETLAQFFEMIIMMIRHLQERTEYRNKINQATGIEQLRLEKEWQKKELHFIRALLTALAIVTVFGLFSFTTITLPLSPILAAVILISSLSRLFIDIEKDQQLIEQLKKNSASNSQIIKENKLRNEAHINDLNNIIQNHIFLPLAIVMFLTSPLPLAVTIMMSLLLIQHVLTTLFILGYGGAEQAFAAQDERLLGKDLVGIRPSSPY